MNRVTLDFESRSPIDLRKVGSWPYAENLLTQIMCLSLKVHGQLPYLWVPPEVLHLYDTLALACCPDFVWVEDPAFVTKLIDWADIIEAHNIEFEVSLWTEIMHKRFGFPDLREQPYFDKLRCSASVAAMHSLPRKLEIVCRVLDLPIQKDDEGHKLMLKMCKPRTPRKAEKEADPTWASKVWYHETPADLLRQAQYCARDVEAEECLSDRLGDLPPDELAVWRIDQRANWRGVTLDQELCRLLIAVREEFLADISAEFKQITGFKPSQTGLLKDWVNSMGVYTETVDKTRIQELLDDETVQNPVRRALEIRQAFAKTSLKKLDKALLIVCTDGRIRSNLMYHGAGTGRWSGKGMQLQNLPSIGLIEDIQQCTEMIRAGVDLETLKLFYTDIQIALSSCIRGVLRASQGSTLYAADFSSIEGRVLAWLAGDTHIIQAYLDGKDMYKIAATTVYPGLTYEEVTKAQRTVGKIPELAGGYGGGWRAYMAFAKTYKLKPPADVVASLKPEDYWDWWLPDEKRTEANRYTQEEAEFCKWFSPIVRSWRSTRQGTVNLWAGLEDACMNAIRNPGQAFEYAGIWYGVENGFLKCRLPSGRCLFYYQPRIMTKEGRPQIAYMATDSSKGGAWRLTFSYGGKLTENVVQAIARDLMSSAMIRIDQADLGIDLLFTVHDEIIEEGPEGCIDLKGFEDMMSVVPDWAEGCPVEAEGWVGEYYRK